MTSAAPIDQELIPLPVAGRAERLALRLLQLGVIAVVITVTLHRSFELDRFFIPKELVLHLVALLAGLLSIRAIRRSTSSRLDLLLSAFVAISVLSAVFAANPWLAMRALAITASSIVLFWTGRALREAGLERALLNTLAFGVVLVAITSLLQTYGIDLEIFSENRAPGGTLGNRNFVAHAAAFGLPLILLAALRAQRWSRYVLASTGAAVVVASLVLTRSRAAWLAFAAVVFVVIVALLFSPALRRSGRVWRRLFGIALMAGVAVGAALLLPNTLRWRSDNPYLETVRRVADYEEGSGRGRLIQYERSLVMAAANPVLGVGPGNWSVEYPSVAIRNDPSMSTAEGGMTFNPWPSSDWVAFVSERGLVAAGLLMLFFASVALAGLRRLLNAFDLEEGLLAVALVAMVAGAIVTGAFDAVLLLALPAFFVWPAIGALSVPVRPDGTGRRFAATLIVLVLLAMSGIGAARSAMQIAAMELSAAGGRPSLLRAAQIDPGNYRVRLRLARSGKRSSRCEHARAARSLYPHATAARSAARGCN